MVLVTGCTGYIGSRLCKRLLASRVQVRGLIRLSEKEKAKSLIEIGLIPYYGDLTDLTSLRKISKDVQLIYHLAGIHSTYNNTYNLYVKGTANLLQTISPEQKIIVASNCSVYADVKGICYEDMRIKTNNPFGEITLKMENTIKEFCRRYVILRIGDVYGDGEANPFIHTNKGITLIGDGMNYSSKIHIDDLINILMKCTEKFSQDVFNVCDDVPIHQIEFYHYAEQLMKKKFVNFKQDVELSERILLSSHGLRALSISMSNEKVKNRLNYKLIFPTYRDGLEYLLGKCVQTKSFLGA